MPTNHRVNIRLLSVWAVLIVLFRVASLISAQVSFQIRPASELQQSCDVPGTPFFTEYYGAVTLDGAPAPAGTVVEAYNPRGERAGCVVVTTPGFYPYMRVYRADSDAEPPIPGMQPGEAVTFKVNGYMAESDPSPVIWTDDLNQHEVSLEASTAPPTSTPTPTATPTDTPTATSTSTNTPTPTPTPTNTATSTPTSTPTPTATPTDTPTATSTSTNTPMPTNTATSTPTSTPTATPTPTSTSCAYDFNNTNDVDIGDVALIAGAWRATDAVSLADYDFNGNNVVDVADIMTVAEHLGEPCP